LCAIDIQIALTQLELAAPTAEQDGCGGEQDNAPAKEAATHKSVTFVRSIV